MHLFKPRLLKVYLLTVLLATGTKGTMFPERSRPLSPPPPYEIFPVHQPPTHSPRRGASYRPPSYEDTEMGATGGYDISGLVEFELPAYDEPGFTPIPYRESRRRIARPGTGQEYAGRIDGPRNIATLRDPDFEGYEVVTPLMQRTIREPSSLTRFAFQDISMNVRSQSVFLCALVNSNVKYYRQPDAQLSVSATAYRNDTLEGRAKLNFMEKSKQSNLKNFAKKYLPSRKPNVKKIGFGPPTRETPRNREAEIAQNTVYITVYQFKGTNQSWWIELQLYLCDNDKRIIRHVTSDGNIKIGNFYDSPSVTIRFNS